MIKKSIQLELFTNLDHNETFTIQDAYEKVTSTDKKHSIRARIYEAIDKGIFEKVSRGVYRFIDSNDNSTLLIKGDGRDLSMIHDNSIDCLITDHPYLDKKSNKGGNRSFADYNSFLYEQSDFDEKFRVLKDGAFMVEFFAEENSNNFDYIYKCKKMAEKSGFEYYTTVNWQKGDFVSNTGRKAKNTEQIIFFTKGAPRSLKLDAKKNLKTATENNIEVKGLTSYEVAQELNKHSLKVNYMKGTSKMLPTYFNVAKTPKKDTIHQAEKPVELFKQLLDYITLPNEIVLDQFAGSCNLGMACKEINRYAILIEKNKETYNKALIKLTA
jgi:hypothetical protein